MSPAERTDIALALLMVPLKDDAQRAKHLALYESGLLGWIWPGRWYLTQAGRAAYEAAS